MKILSQFESRGNVEILSQKILAVFSSINTPEEIYQPAEEIFKKLCDLPISLAGGWQAPLEKQLLDLTSSEMAANIIYYSAKNISRLRMPELKGFEETNKILYISARSRKDRISKEDVDKRDELLFSQVGAVLFLFIAPKGRLEHYFDFLILQDFPVYMLEHKFNKAFINAGAISLNSENAKDLIYI